MHRNNKYCDICGYEFPAIKEDKIITEYEVFQKNTPTPKKPNFCPTCGASMKDAKNFRFCEFCGSKIV
jgi:predicted amidophosphoribosyltransferase